MTAKEKAKELVDKMYEELPARLGRYQEAKQCALIAVEEIILFVGRYSIYWQNVKTEIEQL